MELISSVEFDGVTKFPSLGKRFNLCTISRKNLIAFSAPRCYKLKKAQDDRQSNTIKLAEW